jgi:hypothetical protein
LPEAAKTLTVCDLFPLVDAIRRPRRFQHVPNLVSQEGSTPVVQKLLAGTEVAVHVGPVEIPSWFNRPNRFFICDLVSPLQIACRCHDSPFPRQPSPRGGVDVESRLDHPDVGKSRKFSSKPSFESLDVDKDFIMRRAT